MDRVDAEKGYGFGHFEIGNKTEMLPSAGPEAEATAGVHKVRIPIIIKLLKLQPLDVLVTEESKMLPLTESRLRQALFRPQPFDITSQTPGDHSMIGQLYPPYRQNYGFGGGGATMSAGGMAGMGKEGSVRSLLAAVLPAANGADIEKTALRIAEDEVLQAAFLKNGHSTAKALSLIASAPTDLTAKTASVLPHILKADVAQLQKIESGYLLKTANHAMWDPTEQTIDRGEAVRRFGGKIVLAADMGEGVTVTEGPEAEGEEPADAPQLITEYGLYKVHDMEGNELVGYVFPNLIDLDGKSLPLALFTNGSVACVQGEIVGTPAGEGATLPSGHPRGYGVFYRLSGPEGPEATMPFEVNGDISAEGEVTMMGTSFDGTPVHIAGFQPNIDRVTMEEDVVMIPQDFQWLPLNKDNEVALASRPEEVNKTAALNVFSTVELRADGLGTYSIDGLPVEKLASEDKHFLDANSALFLLGGLGVGHAYGHKKMAEANTHFYPVQIKIGRMVKTADAVMSGIYKAASPGKFSHLKKDLLKEAASLPDPTAVDTVLSLGFLNEENLGHYVSYLPTINESQEKLCEMLVASRLGLQELPGGPIERAIRSIEEVVEGLKVLAFQRG